MNKRQTKKRKKITHIKPLMLTLILMSITDYCYYAYTNVFLRVDAIGSTKAYPNGPNCPWNQRKRFKR